MQATDFFTVVADFVDFARDFLVGRGLEPYARKGIVDPQLILYCATGVGLAYLVMGARKLPGYQRFGLASRRRPGQQGAEVPVGGRSAKRIGMDMLVFLLLLPLGAAITHPLLLAAAACFGVGDMGTVLDTVNAGLAAR